MYRPNTKLCWTAVGRALAGGAAALLLPGICAAQTVLRVSAAAPPGGNGLTWPTAFANIQSALDAASPLAASGQTVQIWVRAGQYLPTRRTIPDWAPSATFHLINRVSLLGGFAGTETAAGQRDPAANITILSGAIGVAEVPNAHHIITGVQVDATAVVDGFTITDALVQVGFAPGSERGGGMRLINASPTVRNCIFRNNRGLYFNNRGAAVYTENGSPTFANCVFLSNVGSGGMGIVHAAGGTLAMTDCTFQENTAGGEGLSAGIYSDAPLTLVRCTFDRNQASAVGAVTSIAPLQATDCRFLSCDGGQGGVGALAMIGGGRLTRCEFIDNLGDLAGAVSGVGTFIACRFDLNGGGSFGVGAVDGGGTFVNCKFTRNGAQRGAVRGSGSFINCVFNGNSSSPVGGGGILRLSGGADQLRNCTIVSNTGGALNYTGTGLVTVANTILWNNGDGAELRQITAPTASLVLQYSYVQGLTGSLGGVGNIGGAAVPSPRLLNPLGPDGIAGTSDDQLQPAPGSFCIDAGSGALVAADIADVDGDGNTVERHPIDILGQPRFRDDTGVPDLGPGPAPVVDIGAFEFQGTSCRADRDRNGLIEPVDVVSFVADWFDSLHQGTLAGDYDGNGQVLPSDVTLFVSHWFGAANGVCPAG